MTVNLSARFTKNTSIYDGLKSIEDKLISNPHETVTVVAVVRRKFLKTDDENGTQTPTVRVLSIEPVFGEAAEQAKALLQAAFKERTGNDEDPTDPNLFDHLSDED